MSNTTLEIIGGPLDGQMSDEIPSEYCEASGLGYIHIPLLIAYIKKLEREQNKKATLEDSGELTIDVSGINMNDIKKMFRESV